MEPQPATPAPGTASNATKDSGTLAWVEGGTGVSLEVSPLLSSEPVGWGEGSGQVCVSRHRWPGGVSSPLAEDSCGPLGTGGRSPEQGLCIGLGSCGSSHARTRWPFPGPTPQVRGSPILRPSLSQLQEVLTLGTNPWGQGPSSGFSPKPRVGVTERY